MKMFLNKYNNDSLSAGRLEAVLLISAIIAAISLVIYMVGSVAGIDFFVRTALVFSVFFAAAVLVFMIAWVAFVAIFGLGLVLVRKSGKK